jgi:nicotinamide-nucleotide amidase
VSVLSIGNELLRGSTVNTNLSLIGKKLASFGFEPKIQTAVPDNADDISEALNFMMRNCGLIISTGGLGPTSDDITKKTFADFFGLTLERDIKTAERVRGFWKKRGKTRIPETVFNQADLIKGAEVIDNEVGTAPGFIIRNKKRKTILMVLPGPPAEMLPMLDEKISSLIKEMDFEKQRCVEILSSGISESLVEEMTVRAIGGEKILPAYCASAEGVRIYLKSKSLSKINAARSILEKKLGQNLISRGAKTVEEEIIDTLRKRKQTLSVAESCTGGMIGGKITDIPGASDVFNGGIIAYSNNIKTQMLGVRGETLKKHGAVSEKCAREMICGLKKVFSTSAAVSITGIAGPGGSSPSKPVGLVFIGTEYNGKIEIRKYIFSGNREMIRRRAVSSALNQLKKILTR